MPIILHYNNFCILFTFKKKINEPLVLVELTCEGWLKYADLTNHKCLPARPDWLTTGDDENPY